MKSKICQKIKFIDRSLQSPAKMPFNGYLSGLCRGLTVENSGKQLIGVNFRSPQVKRSRSFRFMQGAPTGFANDGLVKTPEMSSDLMRTAIHGERRAADFYSNFPEIDINYEHRFT